MNCRFTAVAVGLIVAPGLLAREPDAAKKTILVAKSADAFVNFLPPQSNDDFDAKQGGTLLLTSRETGEMKVLIWTGTRSNHHRRATYFQNRILGVTADRERLYVLVFALTQPDRWPQPADKPFDLPMVKKDAAGRWNESWTFNLLAYRLSDGKLVAGNELKGDGLPTTVPVETTGAGPLKLLKNGVEVYGSRVEFDNTGELKK
jgi:hypothetical protein